MLGTVARAGRLLDLFGPEAPEWGVTSAARQLGIAKSQAHELLVSLAGIGVLERVGPGRYRVGRRVAALYRLLPPDPDRLVEQAAPGMRRLAERCGETLHLAMWDGERAVCIATRDGRHATRLAPPALGADLPAHCTGSGKVLLAARPARELDEVLGRMRLAPATQRTIVSVPRLRAELDAVRRRGFAHEEGEHQPDACAVSAPIVHPDRGVVAAVSLAAPVARWGRHRGHYTRELVAAAAEVSGAALAGSVRNSRTRAA